jgi:alpha-glucosidase
MSGRGPWTSVGDVASNEQWWRSAVVYQVYPRSFADGSGDGVGDIAGLREHLPYLADLGVDAVWISPWYPSPMKDAGYDVSDYRDVEPVFGTMAEAERLIAESHALGLRVLLDIVPNHTSDQHVWFQQALTAGPGSPERARFLFRDGSGPDGAEPPNDWESMFGGRAWTRVPDGQWYLHLFAPEQPDLDWENPEVRADFEATLRFWFDRGIDGFRIDVAHGLIKADGLNNVGELVWPLPPEGELGQGEHPHWDQPTVHEIYRAWRKIADSYDDPRVFVAEAWVQPAARLVDYVRPDELHTAFNFEFLNTPWRADLLRQTIDRTLGAHRRVGAPPTWVLANHDVPREVSRYARPQPDVVERVWLEDLLALPADFALGVRRARAAALLMLALPGGAYIYQGEELGLPEVENLPLDVLQDPRAFQTGIGHGRDGCRVPIPWSGTESPYGFSPEGSAPPWLPQPADWASSTAEAESADPDSVLALYRAALRIRRDQPALGDGDLQWLATPEGVLAFSRTPGFICVVNVSTDPVPLPEGAVLLASGPLSADGLLPVDAAIWISG